MTLNKTAIFTANRGFALIGSRLKIMRGMLDAGWKVIAVGKPDEHFAQLSAAGVQVFPVNFARAPFSPREDWKAYRELRRIYRTLSPSLIHHFNGKPMLVGGMASRAVPDAVVCHTVTGLGNGFTGDGIKKRLVRSLLVQALKQALASSSTAIFQNPDDRDTLVTRGVIPASKTRLILGTGVDTQQFRPGTSSQKRGPLTVLMAGRLVWTKGVREFVEAAATCRQEFPDVEFHLAGSYDLPEVGGVPEAWFAPYVERGIVKVLGHVTDMPARVAAADLVVLPSYRGEGLPRVLIEAAACGVPAVTADTPGCRHAVVDNLTGLIVPPRDAPALAEALGKMLRAPGLRMLFGQAAREHAVQAFDVDVINRQYHDTYAELGLPATYVSARPLARAA